ncbi:AMP-binding protein [Nocardiopsis tropica]|uniref:AMP-binding protein n=2 Tax=Nocardiopsis tropica TaxID=109330 RepID=A0ABU7KM27_9ACTN|nr:AMP-binding protein [Nocardiopsis umidischolae]MEE2050345.1 AMP-binding protein [Nocardiopsis umidischolae]
MAPNAVPPAPSRLRRTLRTVRVLVRAGVLSAGRPDRIVRQLRALRTWGATIAGGYAAANERAPGAVAVIDERGPTTFAEMDLRARQLARELHGSGVVQGTRVGLLCRNHSAFVQTMAACGRLGADTVLLNTGLSAGQLSAAVADNEVAVLVADTEFEPLYAGLPPEVARVTAWGEPSGPGPVVPWEAREVTGPEPGPPERPGRLIVLTSGTTGAPKGARRPTPKGPQDAASVLSRIPLRSSDRILVSAPVFHTWGLAGVQLGMSMRATLMMRPKTPSGIKAGQDLPSAHICTRSSTPHAVRTTAYPSTRDDRHTRTSTRSRKIRFRDHTGTVSHSSRSDRITGT